MPLDLVEIRKLKVELRRDLDALDRLEALVNMRQKSDGSSKQQAGLPLPDEGGKPSLRGNCDGCSRKGIETTATHGDRHPRYGAWHHFTSPRKGMGSVTKVLFRQLGKSVEKLKDGTYVLKK